ncbi:hypothetical protein [Microbulbifer taiwanensis]|uniref:hypothetical protein n=1 Tax=Microbulbifer taiwanensis TaxID=986746 RepID=UPI00360B8C70
MLADCEGAPEAIIIATGSEVELAMAARKNWPTKRYAWSPCPAPKPLWNRTSPTASRYCRRACAPASP